MKEIFKKIMQASAHMQDLRDDEGHAEMVAEMALKLCEEINCDKDIVIPAAILHDTGYFGMNYEKLKLMMSKNLTKEEEEEIKTKHMINGANNARAILLSFNYPEKESNIIIDIVRRHDLSDEPKSVEEKIVRDADKLWRYSRKGFFLDVKRRSIKPEEWHEKLAKNFEKPTYFQLEVSKKIAKQELAKRKEEFLKN